MRTAVVFAAALALAGCGSISSMNPFASKDERLVGDRETVFSTTSVMDAAGGSASVGAARSNSDWPQPGGNAQNAPGHVAFAGGGSRAWRANVGGTGRGALSAVRGDQRIAARPVVAGDRVFVYSPDGSVTALSLGNGRRIWRTSLRPERERDAAAGGGVTFDSGTVFAATGYGQIAALDPSSGDVRWTRDLDTPVRSAPSAGSGKVFVVSQRNEVFAVNQADGTEAFTYAGIPEQAGLMTVSSPALTGETVVVPYSSGEVMAFSIESGEPKWQNFVTRSSRTMSVAGLTDVSGSPVIDGGTVYATGVSGRTVAVALSDGTERWRADVGSAHTPVVSGDAVFLVDVGNRMVALSRADGSKLWVTQLPQPKKKRDLAYSGPVLAGGALYSISNNGRMARVDPASGRLIEDRTIGVKGFTSPIVASGQMIIVSDAGEITALR
ncbi:MAG: PQQ-binding-like beta-propeller repeat protein [Pseudomonadota bacterium]